MLQRAFQAVNAHQQQVPERQVMQHTSSVDVRQGLEPKAILLIQFDAANSYLRVSDGPIWTVSSLYRTSYIWEIVCGDTPSSDGVGHILELVQACCLFTLPTDCTQRSKKHLKFRLRHGIFVAVRCCGRVIESN